MNDFTFQSPTALCLAVVWSITTGAELAARGVKSVLVVYGGGSVVRTGTLERVMNSLDNAGIAHVELGGVRPNPEIASVRAGIELVRAAESIDMILPVGGGSVIDCAKAIGARRLLRRRPVGFLLQAHHANSGATAPWALCSPFLHPAPRPPTPASLATTSGA